MRVSTVVVLGNRLQFDGVHPELKGRMDIGIKLWRDASAIYLILTGGRTNAKLPISECSVMQQYAIANGVPSSNIICENKALDTIGNGAFCRMLIDKLQHIQVIYVVSSCYHMKRVEYVFRKCLGSRYAQNYDNCFDTAAFDISAEYRSYQSAQQFFHDVESGDIEKISDKMYGQHDLYSHQTR